MENQQPKNYAVTVEEPSAPEPRAYRVIRTENQIRPFVVVNGHTGEELFGCNFFTVEEAERRIAEDSKDHMPKRTGHVLGGIDDMSEAALLERESPSMKDYWQQKRVTLDRLEKRTEAKTPEPEPQPSKDPTMPVSVQEVAELEAKLSQAQTELAKLKGSEVEQVTTAVEEVPGDALEVAEANLEAEEQLAALKQRVEQVEQLTENVSRLAEMYS